MGDGRLNLVGSRTLAHELPFIALLDAAWPVRRSRPPVDYSSVNSGSPAESVLVSASPNPVVHDQPSDFTCSTATSSISSRPSAAGSGLQCTSNVWRS